MHTDTQAYEMTITQAKTKKKSPYTHFLTNSSKCVHIVTHAHTHACTHTYTHAGIPQMYHNCSVCISRALNILTSSPSEEIFASQP